MSRLKDDLRPLRWVIIGIWLAAGCQFILAQTALTSGSIRGVVTDNSEAVISGASVVLTSRAYGETQTSSSNAAGIFVFPSQPVGSYTLAVSAPGFRKQVVEPILVEVGQTASVRTRLQPGSGSDSVTVIGESPLLQTENSNLSSVINRDLLNGLPLNGRRFLDLALLVPNASPDGEQGLVSFAGEQGGQDTGYANANGSNSFSVDGASATSNYFGAARGGERVPYIFGENAVQEFQVAVSPYRSEYGGAATGFVNVVTRSGSVVTVVTAGASLRVDIGDHASLYTVDKPGTREPIMMILAVDDANALTARDVITDLGPDTTATEPAPPATVEKRANTGVFTPTSVRTPARVYFASERVSSK